ncbi:hypothetical protein P910_001855 [Xylella fastidiosa Mul-MD]|nr:hypothetical protein P303_12840 [Xylella fastidiosa MUL0034]EWG14775.1 hypothetical protein P910_001855 [Xylella fastidiosa Mul-MD]
MAHQVLEVRRRGRIGETAIRERLSRRLQHQCDAAACQAGGLYAPGASVDGYQAGEPRPGRVTDAERLDMVMWSASSGIGAIQHFSNILGIFNGDFRCLFQSTVQSAR